MAREAPHETVVSGQSASDRKATDASFNQHHEARRRETLDRYEKAFRAGSLPALYEALWRCREQNWQAPSWMVEGSIIAMELLSPFNRRPKRGRGRNPLRLFRQNLIHAVRYYMVQEVRDVQKEAQDELRRFRKLKVSAKELDLARRFCERMGRSWDDAYEVARAELEGTIAFGSASTMKYSYRHVKGFEKVPGASPRFMTIRPELLSRLGIREKL